MGLNSLESKANLEAFAPAAEVLDEETTMSAEPSNKTPDPMDVALGAAVRIRRRTIGMSQEALAEQCGVSFQQIQKYENGANRISFSRLVQIARALRCRVVDLMDVLDTPAGEGDVDLLSRMRTPGALELLSAFERLPQEARSSLVNLLRVMTDPDAPQRGRQKEVA
ncbi:MAG: helix-turn-helix domain-containing protein [Gammaproteobacteria bacterium]|jgi:transcriptional regulator with XRE-family HTH domain|nr:MAG: helix-turn-helix domain-containing protein [Gammaproteobacteria bacterium]